MGTLMLDVLVCVPPLCIFIVMQAMGCLSNAGTLNGPIFSLGVVTLCFDLLLGCTMVAQSSKNPVNQPKVGQ